MLRAICCAVVGLVLLLLGALAIRSLDQAAASRIPMIYVSVVLGLLLVGYGIFYARLLRYRKLGFQDNDGSPGSYMDVPVGDHSADCGHGDGGGADCGVDGVSH